MNATHATGIENDLYPDKDTQKNPFVNGHSSLSDAILEEVKQTSAFVHPLLSKVFIPDWTNKPPEVPAILTSGGTPVLTYQNILTIIAQPGLGKSSIGEAIAASALNPDADSLGLSVSSQCKKILIIDNERTYTDVWNGFFRMCKRAGIQPGIAIDKITIASLRAIPRSNDKQKVIEHFLQQQQYDLIYIDGAGDLVEDVNDMAQAIECRIWMREISVTYKTSIIVTIHPNPNTNKPRGHQGSELCRESECVLLGKKVDEIFRVLTSDFEYGKNRNNASVTTAFIWNDEAAMFVSADADCITGGTSSRKNPGKAKAELLVLKILPPPNSMSYTELREAIMEADECSKPTAKRKITDMIDYGFIKKHDDGNYRAI